MHTSPYPVFAVTVDVAVLTVHDGRLRVLLVERGGEPYAGQLALPGGFVGPEEDLEEAALRELGEEAGVSDVVIEQLRSYGRPDRDPRQRVVSVAHVAVLPAEVPVAGGDDAARADWYDVAAVLDPPGEQPPLAFDHQEILTDAVERVRAKLEYTTLATAFVGEEFSLSELRGVYEAIWGRELDPGNFQRKVRQTEGLVDATGETRLSTGGRGRPAATYRAARPGVHDLKFPISR